MDIRVVEGYCTNHLSDLLRSMFIDIELKDRFHVERASDQWSKEDKFIWEIKNGRQSDVFYIYFDGEMVCDFEEHERSVIIDKRFLQGFLDAYKDDRIYLIKGMRESEDKRKRQEKLMADEAKKAKARKEMEKLTTDEREIVDKVTKKMKNTKKSKKKGK